MTIDYKQQTPDCISPTVHHETEKALRKALAQNEQLIASITSILITLDRDNRITQWNSTAERVLGIKASDVVGHSFEECGVQWDQAELMKGVVECRAKRTQQRLDDFQFKQGENEAFLGITINPFTGDDPGVLILGADITKRKLLEGQLLQSQKLESIGPARRRCGP